MSVWLSEHRNGIFIYPSSVHPRPSSERESIVDCHRLRIAAIDMAGAQAVVASQHNLSPICPQIRVTELGYESQQPASGTTTNPTSPHIGQTHRLTCRLAKIPNSHMTSDHLATPGISVSVDRGKIGRKNNGQNGHGLDDAISVHPFMDIAHCRFGVWHSQYLCRGHMHGEEMRGTTYDAKALGSGALPMFISNLRTTMSRR